MNSPLSINRLYIIFSFLLFSNLLTAQGSSNMSLLGNWDQNTITRNGVKYNDIWGYVDDLNNEYAVVGSPEKVHFIDVTDPANLVQLAEFTPGASTVWRDFKTYDRFVYAVADEGNEGLLVFDMNSLPNGEICQVYQDNSIFGRAHNIYIDVPTGFLYVVGANTNDWIVYDLKPDPSNPTLVANQGVYGNYIHDMFVHNGVAYASSETSLIMFDITDPTNPTYIAEQGTSGYNHSSWLTEDGNNVIFAEESSGFSLGVLDITNAANDDIPVINSFKFPLEEAGTGDARIVYHNPFILGDYAIVSSYYDGVTIFNISNPNNVTMDAYYDTFVNNGYSGYAADGCWGVYPYLPSGNIIASDTETGLYVLSTTVPLPTGRCGNGVLDPFEQQQDCGGFCAPCGTPTPTCASCTDGIQNGDETGIDCGGTTCNPCVGCNDGIQNGTETGIDCGGNCAPCPTCTDGIQNGNETAIDCGGADCAACPPEDCSIRDFTNDTFVSYDDQDNGTETVLDNGATVYLAGNAWKAIQIDYPITPNTVLELDFRSDVQGEIHEISFDTDLSFSPDLRLFLHGNDVNNTPYTGSGNYEHFTFSIGASLPSGTMTYLLLTCDDDANAAGDSYFKNIQIYEDYNNDLTCGVFTCSDGILNGNEEGVDCGGSDCPTCPSDSDCSIRDFSNDTFVSYDSQDNGTETVLDNGATVYLAGNAWKAIQIDYPITSNTVLELDFRSDVQGEIHEISFDTDLLLSPDLRLFLHGNDVNNTPYTGSGNYEHFTFSIGASLPSGTMTYLLLTCDDDANAAGDSYFRNIQIYEDYNNNLMCDEPAVACPVMDNIGSTVSSGNYQASNTITSDAQIIATENVTYGANTICLENGFEVVLGGEFLGEINPCTPFTQAPNQRLTKETINVNTKKSNISLNQMGNSDTWTANILIEEAGTVEVYLEDENNKTTIFSDHAKAGYLRLRFNSATSNTPKLVVKTKTSKVSKTIKSSEILD